MEIYRDRYRYRKRDIDVAMDRDILKYEIKIKEINQDRREREGEV